VRILHFVVWLVLVPTLALLCSPPAAGYGQETIDRQYEIKSAYLWHFGRYVTWPSEPSEAAKAAKADFVIGVLGEDSFLPHLRRIAASKTVNGRTIVVKQFHALSEYAPCHILCVSQGALGTDPQKRKLFLAAVLKKTAGSPVLLVADVRGLAQNGAAIDFYVDRRENRIKLTINLDAARRANLKISSRLLALKKTGVVSIVRDSN
jgi:hypothetical protein